MALRSIEGSRPPTETEPEVGEIRPAIRRRRVDFPDPFRPRIPIRCWVRSAVIPARMTRPGTENPASVREIPGAGIAGLFIRSAGLLTAEGGRGKGCVTGAGNTRVVGGKGLILLGCVVGVKGLLGTRRLPRSHYFPPVATHSVQSLGNLVISHFNSSR